MEHVVHLKMKSAGHQSSAQSTRMAVVAQPWQNQTQRGDGNGDKRFVCTDIKVGHSHKVTAL